MDSRSYDEAYCHELPETTTDEEADELFKAWKTAKVFRVLRYIGILCVAYIRSFTSSHWKEILDTEHNDCSLP